MVGYHCLGQFHVHVHPEHWPGGGIGVNPCLILTVTVATTEIHGCGTPYARCKRATATLAVLVRVPGVRYTWHGGNESGPAMPECTRVQHFCLLPNQTSTYLH